MPNWCYNIVEVRGNSKDLKALIKKIKSEKGDFDFNNVIPYPEAWAELDEKCRDMREQGVDSKDIPKDGFNSGGYTWCLHNWDTKWNACEPVVSVGVKFAIMSFDTAWSPSLNITKVLSTMFPKLKFKHSYEESGCDFSGYRIYKNGETLEQVEGNYDALPITEHYYEDEDE